MLHGGYVDCGNDDWRMQGSLRVSRAIGDKHLGRRLPFLIFTMDVLLSQDTLHKAFAKRLDDNNAQATSQVTTVPCVDRCDKPHAKRTHRQTSNEIQKNSRPDISVIDTDERYTDEEQEQTRNHWSTESLLKVNPQNYQRPPYLKSVQQNNGSMNDVSLAKKVTQESTGPQCRDHDPQAVPNYRIDQGVGSTGGIRACALRNFDLEFENTQNNALAKLPMLKLGEYEMWEIRIKQYLQIQDYAL
ncbi:hypothetical protein Tco_1561490 [Tanacetum coccineum]